MAFSQKLSAVQAPYPVVTSNYVPGLRLEFTRFYGETGHFKFNFSIENSNFSQFFESDIHIHTFSDNFPKKNRFIGTLKLTFIYRRAAVTKIWIAREIILVNNFNCSQKKLFSFTCLLYSFGKADI